MSATTNWIESVEIPEDPTPSDVRTFFGVPPDPEGKLDANISRKRRQWQSKVRGQKPSPEAKEKAARAIELITFLAEYLKRGTDEPLDLADLREAFKHAPKTSVGDLDELWQVIEELLASGEVDEALRVANEARTRFADEPVAHGAFAWVAANASRGQEEPSERMRLDGVESAEKAIAGGSRLPEVYRARAVLQLDLQRGDEALAGLRQAEAQLGDDMPPALSAFFVEAFVAVGDTEQAATRAGAIVDAAPEDLGLRSGITFALIAALRNSLLPISSAQGLADYKRIAEIAAWCAVGAPEAEDAVRPYRMWGVVADNRMYTGDVMHRAFIAVITGFLLLPVMNRIRSKPQWSVFHEGPESASATVFSEVAHGTIATLVHQGITDRLTWWASYQATGGR
jgi:hypothetical protein